ncbi:Diaminohydroxyphosphoribosylaminopyrimidine deaminase (EC / 5-amino-6-(5-phosphoribosylamino)uracil reductase (EC [uncultured Gammaproteobacteria bacterium]|jgi:diaminohydroxyphosphoribosylaminopyrimidine deaminase/5-amino-6-(5-phosphoribosylamino)uracil reductase|uniref:bifunctional diaminohydroxyphosphoribosylaminopyrimidine deaminase/5-amino-6-(5-phosphoribosylamino)uracil reductase RibD n=1 Tax=thiotrophic endosymbiont of Bathymodiolus puteoserpentis (Logatchev) TaxID=343240 RepID=UPI0010B180A6|nr:bifunctional diaminohydroxyphosphoribosylaminopyrimidine deaminase/5-amino-6-(5-phosphoribosylamino)uracil reductase RibD [thiotrophic endosymbiont of Bathymodiolus puteoserpentis (Logatchev)]CAC9499813.1 Diaminohydroxyphosphoribosylaminopyrimidinedeaminase (EC 3.5.4.26) / 5-amino-6-(5-phosphoribosylamino)uracil reductase (EC 1.1.1.193) [uncultured Gammaproteobacteria bacterium]CAC9639594.1 Diaminohydroxyphosphoribosylaminopyrimidinedeaminase (EC 3.5.4.26) / 5-amino-6-(5-phosphoribosylamino)ur
MTTFSKNDTHFMSLALQLARKGRYGVASNPMVGCVIVKDNKILAEGHHQTFGKAHAEINALTQINHQADGATLYVTLEPCAHQGKTPPCAQTIIDASVKEVVIATLDPNPLVSGKGVAILADAGIVVRTGLLENESKELNRGFIKRMETGLPFVTCKIAMSIDGKTSMASGQSKWITGKEARQDVQKLRAKNQAILTGSSTILADNPLMTVRLDGVDSTPLRVVIDGKNQITDTTLKIFSNDANTKIFNSGNTQLNKAGKLDLHHVLVQLAQQNINSVLLEAGPKLIGAMVEEGLVDEFILYTAPILMGSHATSMMALAIQQMDECLALNIRDIRMVGNDIKITAILK